MKGDRATTAPSGFNEASNPGSPQQGRLRPKSRSARPGRWIEAQSLAKYAIGTVDPDLSLNVWHRVLDSQGHTEAEILDAVWRIQRPTQHLAWTDGENRRVVIVPVLEMDVRLVIVQADGLQFVAGKER